MNNSFLRNWHNPKYWARTQRKEMPSGAVVPGKGNKGLTLTINKGFNEQLIVELNEEDTKLFFMNIDRFYHQKEGVRRENYGLPANPSTTEIISQ